MDEAYAGIDVAFAKRKRLPIVVCRRQGDILVPLSLQIGRVKPPAGEGNARTLERTVVDEFAHKTVEYLQAIESEFGVRIRRVAIDAPSDPRPAGTARRQAEIELDRRRISCITTPDVIEFESIRARAIAHLAHGRPESRLPGANQLWMIVGFSLFRSLRQHWECLEVFPHAIATVLRVGAIHKSRTEGLTAQLESVARHTGWPSPPIASSLRLIGYGAGHDRLDAYLAAWVASLEESAREPFGEAPTDVIWVPRIYPAA
jgi:hypothetical protein